jgi:hypothetical protein
VCAGKLAGTLSEIEGVSSAKQEHVNVRHSKPKHSSNCRSGPLYAITLPSDK